MIMAKLNIKGHEIIFIPATSSFDRRTLQYKNKIITELGKLGVKREDVEFDYEGPSIKPSKALVGWFMGRDYLSYDNNSQTKYVDNLAVVAKLIEKEVELVVLDKKPINEFMEEFRHDEEHEAKRKEAREFFGLTKEEERDLELINRKYKDLAKTLHPDMPTGNTEKFKQLNNAHKILKKELS
jgi:hypothetical protein